MPYHLQFGEADRLRIRFALSPMWETHAAVRVLARPRQQGYHLPWLRRIRQAEGGLDLGPLHLLMPQHGHSPDFLYPPPLGPAATFEEELAAVRRTDPALVHDDLARALGTREIHIDLGGMHAFGVLIELRAAGAAADSTARDATAVRARRRSMRSSCRTRKNGGGGTPVFTNAPHAAALRNPGALLSWPTA